VPYVLFQGIFSTKRRRDLKTLPGFLLNRRTLLAARHVFTNKAVDLRNLKRLIPEERITYVAPGLRPAEFSFNPDARAQLRREWDAGDDPVVLSVAMFRPGVKTEGLVTISSVVFGGPDNAKIEEKELERFKVSTDDDGTVHRSQHRLNVTG
jgi:hypothetical protein